jgi:hypothetical protein
MPLISSTLVGSTLILNALGLAVKACSDKRPSLFGRIINENEKKGFNIVTWLMKICR